jgi:hypothetical protein
VKVSRLGLLFALFAGACATEGELSRTLYKRLPRDARMAIYDRENDLTIAKSRRDEALAQLAEIGRRKDELSQALKTGEARLKKSGHGERSGGLRKMAGARRAFYDAQAKTAKMAMKYAEAEIDAATARLEQARQQQLIRFGLAQESTLVPFDATVKQREKDATQAQRQELDARAQQQQVFTNWKAAEEQYASSTGDFDAGIWID